MNYSIIRFDLFILYVYVFKLFQLMTKTVTLPSPDETHFFLRWSDENSLK